MSEQTMAFVAKSHHGRGLKTLRKYNTPGILNYPEPPFLLSINLTLETLIRYPSNKT